MTEKIIIEIPRSMGSETMDVLSAGTVFEDGSAYPCSGSSCNVYKDSDCINCLVNTDNRTIWEYDVTESTYTIKLVDITSVEVHMNHDLKSLTGISKKVGCIHITLHVLY